MKDRYLLATIPKSGTYLLAEVLERLGLNNTHWHLGARRWQDYSRASHDEARLHPENFTHEGVAEVTAASIPQGSFAASHLGPKHLKSVPNLKVIFLHRDLRETIPSWARWIRGSRRWGNRLGWMDRESDDSVIAGFLEEHGKLVAGENRDVAEWRNVQGCLSVAHGALVGQFGKEAQSLVAEDISVFLDDDRITKSAVLEAIISAMASETLTKTPTSGKHSVKLAWGVESATLFRQIGLEKLNDQLGYGLPGLMHLRESYRATKKIEVSCPICGCADKRVLVNEDRYGMPVTVNACTSCLHGYVGPVPDTRWFDTFYRDIYWQIYSFGGMSNERRLSESRGGQIVQRIKPLLNASPSRVMDVGCGSCGMLPVVRREFPNALLIATDPSSEAVETARNEGADEVYQTAWRDSEDRSNGPAGVSLATCIHVLEHVRDPLEMLGNLRRAMSDGGYLYLEVPNLMSSKWFGIGFFHLAHVNYFGSASLQLALEKTGFKVLETLEGVTREWPWGVGMLAVAAPPDTRADPPEGVGVNELVGRVRKQLAVGRPGIARKIYGKLRSLIRG